MRTLPAAAIKAGDTVLLAREEGGARLPITVSRVHNADPVAGEIRWETGESGDVTVSAADRVEVLSLA